MRARSYIAWFWLCPAAALLIPFFILPLGIIVRNSVYRDDPMGFLVAEFTAANYLRAITDPYYITIFSNTLLVAAIVTIAALFIAYPFAYLVVRASGGSRSILIWCIYVPLYVSVIMRAFGWTIILSDSGLINEGLIALRVIQAPVRLLYEAEGMTLAMLHRYLPLMLIPLVAALQKIDQNLVKASRNLGATRAHTLWRVTLPLSLPGIVAGSQLVFAGVLSDYAMPALMGSTKFPLLAPAIYYEAMTNGSWGLAGAMATLVLIIVALFILVMNGLLKRMAPWAPTL